MTAVFVFALLLLAAVLISELADRSVLSTAVLFLLAGVITGKEMLGIIALSPEDPAVSLFAELALFSILYTDGMRVGINDLVSAWHLPGRALLFGLPLTLVGTALIAHWIVGLPWAEAFLIGAVLSPTDPVFAAAIVGREEVPVRLRGLLNVESGLNDGLALPIVVAMLAVVDSERFDVGATVFDVVAGVGIGIVVPWCAIRLEQSRFFRAHATYQPLNGFAIGLLVLTISTLLGANAFLAAFAAGITVATAGPEVRQAFHQFGELIAELLKLAALLVFGALISPRFLAEISVSGYVFAVLVLIAVRPLALLLSLARSPLGWREQAAAAWFGPKGFASVVFGLLILKEAEAGRIAWARADELFHLVALCIAASIIAHSSTDVLVARWLARQPNRAPSADPGSTTMDRVAHDSSPSARSEDPPSEDP